MLKAFGSTQQLLLRALFHKKAGLSTEDLVSKLGITKTAVRQHLTALQDLGFVEQGESVSTGGRPGFTYHLTERGENLFPKQYSWFSEILLQSVQAERGPKGFADWLADLGRTIGKSVSPGLEGTEGPGRLEAIIDIMNDLGYEAYVNKKGPEKGISATNCVYHALAVRFPEVCQFDIALLKELTGEDVEQKSCIVRGGECCAFKFRKS